MKEDAIPDIIVPMSQAMKSPWTAVILAIIVMTIGYTFYLKQNGELAAINNYFCPADELCKKAGCNGENDCSKDVCASCPFCNKEAS